MTYNGQSWVGYKVVEGLPAFCVIPPPGTGGIIGGRGDDRPAELRFVNEARVTGQLEHPGIVPVYELGRRSDDTLYYAMRLVSGHTLQQAMRDRDLRGHQRPGLLCASHAGKCWA